MLHEAFPGFTIDEEVPIEVGQRRPLFVDLVVRELRVAIECQGEQHYRFNPHFHGDPEAFLEQQRRDRLKADALREADYVLVVVRHDEMKKLTTRRLAERITKALQEK